MAIKRKLIKIDQPEAQPGFLGAGHLARPLINRSFSDSDPFIMLMDDMLDKKDTDPVGGPHPHAGFETVTLLLEGEIGDEAHKMKAGDFQMMTAGSGIVHTETIDKISRMRLLQLWLNLPKKDRWTRPRVQDLQSAHVPSLSEKGISIKLYSGSLAGLTSQVLNYTSLIVADVAIEAGVTTIQQIPGMFNGFLYVLRGSVRVGEDRKQLKKDEVGWLNLIEDNNAQTDLALTAGEEGVRLVLYAGNPTGDSIVSYGPFIADTADDIQRLYKEYREGKMKHISTVPESQRRLL
jgi:redox-sensitive bicupin YhaK (pirin superfamily)